MLQPYKFGLSNHPLKLFETNEKHTEKLEELKTLKDYSLIIRICKHYIQNFIPTPIENEDEYWMSSCFPGKYNTPVRINIYWHEVLNISPADDYSYDDEKWVVVIFTNRKYLTSDIIIELQNKIPELQFDEDYRYEKGLDSQLAAILPIEAYFDFVVNENVFESIREYNYELSNKGKRVHKGHNYEFARVLLQI